MTLLVQWGSFAKDNLAKLYGPLKHQTQVNFYMVPASKSRINTNN
jgi:hypothetical protein